MFNDCPCKISDENETMDKKNAAVRNKWLVLGIVLIMSSGLAFALMLVIPFLPLTNKTRMIGSGASFIAMEVLFWSGGLLLGKELLVKYKEKLNPKNWVRKNRKKPGVPQDAGFGE